MVKYLIIRLFSKQIIFASAIPGKYACWRICNTLFIEMGNFIGGMKAEKCFILSSYNQLIEDVLMEHTSERHWLQGLPVIISSETGKSEINIWDLMNQLADIFRSIGWHFLNESIVWYL